MTGAGAGPTIAVNAAIVGERPTGLGLYALALVRALDALGERLVVFSSRADLLAGSGALPRPAPAAVRPERGATGHVLRILWTQLVLRARLRSLRPSLLLNVMPEGLLAPAMPQVTVIHDVLPLRYIDEYPRQQYYFRHYVPAVLRASRAVVVSSESTRRDLLHFYGLPPALLRVVPCGYDAGRFTPGPPAGGRGRAPYALYVGNVMPHKNLERLVEAFARAAAGTDRRLVIIGSGRPVHEQALRRSLATAGVAGQVEWRPYATDEELPRLYREARMLLLPSLYEGFGMTALEAMACGTPVIASSASSLPEVVGEAGLLVDPLDAPALAGAIGRLFADDGLAAALRQRGIARARLFSWERTGREVQEVIREALASPRPSGAPAAPLL